ncbi:HpsJ family protein [Merismopedia glauca]|nr:HpsJ family protein [Merismopedia glauca]
MKANNTLTLAPFLLKTVGGLLILASLVEYILLFFPPAVSDPKLLDQYWKIDFWNQLVNSGVVPLVGMLLIFAGYWMSSTLNISPKRPFWQDLRFWVALLATILGIAYLVTIPVYLSNVNFVKEDTIKNIDAKTVVEKDRLNKQLEQVNAQLAEYQKVAKDKPKLEQEIARITQAINSGQVQGTQLEQFNNARANLESLKNNSQVLEQRNKQIQEEAKKELARIDSSQKDAKAITANNAILSVTKTDLKSLILAIAHTIVGWMGLKNVLTSSPNTVEKWE